MAYKYIVTVPFHDYQIGAEITDPDEIAKVLATHDPHVVRVTVPEPTPDAPKEGA